MTKCLPICFPSALRGGETILDYETMITATLVFDHRGRTKAGADGPIEIRITNARKAYYISTEIRCRKSEWVACSISETKPGHVMLNRRLAILLDFVNNEINNCILEQRPVDVDDIRHKMRRFLNVKRETVLDWIEEQIPELKVTEGTRRHYVTLLNRLSAFAELRYWDDVKVETIYAFDSWLHKLPKSVSEAGRMGGIKPETIGDGAVFNYHKCLKALLSRAERMGRIERNPYTRLRGEFARGDRETVDFLTDDEVAAFERLHPVAGTELAVARDLFVFQLHTGLSYADTQVFDFSKYELVDGRWTFIGKRVKTGVEYITQLSDECIDIIERYGGGLPKMTNSNYNLTLKTLATVAGIDRNLRSHMARHTFATQMLAQNVKIENVAKMLGHTNAVQTHRYAKVLPKSVFDDFTKFHKKSKNEKQ